MNGTLPRTLYGLILLAAVGLAGCGSNMKPVLGEVEGTVRNEKGQPLANVVVQFLPVVDQDAKEPRPHSTAVTDENGHYRLRCQDKWDGAVVGMHKVTVEDPTAERPPQGKEPRTAPRLAPRYASAADTPLKREVQAGHQTIDLPVTSQ